MQKIPQKQILQLDNRYRTTATIYLAQIFTTVILITVGLFFIDNFQGSASATTLTALWAVIVFIAIGSFVLRRMLSRWERLKDIKLLKGIAGVLSALQTNAILHGSLAETIAVIGFTITALNGEKADVLRAGGVALIIFLMNFPRKSVWKKIAANLEKV